MHFTTHLLSILSLLTIANSAALPVAGRSRSLQTRDEDTTCQDNCTAQVEACVAGSINAIARLGWYVAIHNAAEAHVPRISD